MSKDQDRRDQTISHLTRVVSQLIWLGGKRSAQQLAAHGLTAPQFFTLGTLLRLDQACPMHALAEATHQDAATVTGIVDRLIRLGYVSRRRGESDRRKVYAVPEQAGRQVVEKVRQASHENWRRSFAALSQDDLDEMLRILEIILNAWESDAETPQG